MGNKVLLSCCIELTRVNLVLCRAKQGSSGSGFNRLCLTNSPDVGSAHHDDDHSGGLLVGAEYEISSSGLRTLLPLNSQPIPCSVCETNGSAVLMVPGIAAVSFGSCCFPCACSVSFVCL